MTRLRITVAAAKRLVFVACLIPAADLVVRAFTGGLGVNPIEYLTHQTGIWALRLLLVTLAVTPLRRVTGWNPIIRFRRMLGLFAFTYASLHFLVYLVLDQFFAFDAIVEDVALRRFIMAGFTAFVLLVPLAVTSTEAMIRRMGRRWQQLHRLVYVSAAGGVVHYLWLVKADVQRPVIYGTILAALLAFRAWRSMALRVRSWRQVARA